MSDLITSARKEWCERREEETGNVTWFLEPRPCPPEVVAALLDALKSLEGRVCPDCGSSEPNWHFANCRVGKALAAITRALEDKA